MIDQEMAGVLVPIPLPSQRVFRNQAMDDILGLLYRNPHDAFGVRELREVSGHGAGTVDTAITLFTQLDLIETRREGTRKLISINRDRIQKPDDPVLAIPQEQFRTPVDTFLDEVQTQEDDLVGVLVFGSVARGEADRTSDIDVFIVVADDLLGARRHIQDIRQDVSNRTFEGDRYEFQVMVESIDSADQHAETLRPIFSEGITLYETDQLDGVRREVLHGR